MSLSELSQLQSAIKILLIEDAETDCVAFTRYLRADPDRRYDLLTAENLNTGMELWRSQSPDVVLLDLHLPDGNGLEFLEFMRTESAGQLTAKVPVIVLSGQGNEQVAVRAMKLGAMDYLVKGDITSASLRKSVEAIIEYHALVKQLDRSQQQKELLSEIALRIRQSLDLPNILQAAVDGLRQLLDCDRAILYEFQPDWSGFVSVESVRLAELSLLHQEIVDPCLASRWHESYLHGRTSFVSDREDPSLKPCYAKMLASFQIRANLVTPILQDQHLWGLLIAHECHHPRTWDTSEIQLVKQLATQVSIAIQQATAYAQLQTELKERREAEAQLQRLNQDLENRVAQRTADLTHYIQEVEDLYNNAPCGYHSLDPQGRYVRVNETELQWLGYSREEMLGKSVAEFLTEESRQAFAQNFQVFLEQGWVKNLEYEMVCKDGSLLPVLLSATSVKDEMGRLLHNRATMIDIRDRKQFEQHLQETNLELARISRLKDEFLANMSHELRTPLTAILGMSDVLQEGIYGELNGKQSQYIKVIHESGKHLLSLINDILDLAKIESGTLELQIASVCVQNLCQHSLSFVKQIAQKKLVELNTIIPADVGDIEVDELRIRQALINLLSNAVKFTPEGGKVTLAVERDRTQRRIEFSVTDTGIGIAAEHLPKLFQSFMQIDSSLNRQYGGTGLGLALIRRIVELHGGEVAVESVLGEGSCFRITLPDDL
ncbi:ATP-binding protein [Leptolyngbya ohadii]|uniref:ATP-binding protein n=1 Tax=Leptolyngbya ohadii TaxID=1962290 RepID=UPI000B599A2D|nr:ATP-binding protein [Leptolyngbya ohadii]